jgi:hypothetical protein
VGPGPAQQKSRHHAHHSLEDPYEDKTAARQRRYFLLLLLLITLALFAAHWFEVWPFAPTMPAFAAVSDMSGDEFHRFVQQMQDATR